MEDTVVMPHWMRNTLGIGNGGVEGVNIKYDSQEDSSWCKTTQIEIQPITENVGIVEGDKKFNQGVADAMQRYLVIRRGKIVKLLVSGKQYLFVVKDFEPQD